MVERSKNINKYVCEKCNKVYKNRSGLWYHNEKLHKPDPIEECVQNVAYNNQNVHTKLIQNIVCKYCNKQLSNRHSRWRHEKTCSNKTNLEKQNKLYEKTIEDLIYRIERAKLKSLILILPLLYQKIFDFLILNN